MVFLGVPLAGSLSVGDYPPISPGRPAMFVIIRPTHNMFARSFLTFVDLNLHVATVVLLRVASASSEPLPLWIPADVAQPLIIVQPESH